MGVPQAEDFRLFDFGAQSSEFDQRSRQLFEASSRFRAGAPTGSMAIDRRRFSTSSAGSATSR